MNDWKPTWKDEVERAYRRAAVLIDLDQDPPTKKEHLTCKEVRMIIDDLVKAHDKQREELREWAESGKEGITANSGRKLGQYEATFVLGYNAAINDLLTKLEK